jgi:hypothetical protein
VRLFLLICILLFKGYTDISKLKESNQPHSDALGAFISLNLYPLFKGYTGISKLKEKLSLAWRILSLFSCKIESFLDGTPCKTPVAAINVLIGISEVC